jgi:hypothetical protein
MVKFEISLLELVTKILIPEVQMCKPEIKGEVPAIVHKFVNTLEHGLEDTVHIGSIELACSCDRVLVAVDRVVALLLDGVL